MWGCVVTRLALEQHRYQQAVLAQLRLTAGIHGRPALPTVRQAWADTRALTVIGALLIAAASISWLAVMP